jgi:hypothetical protein
MPLEQRTMKDFAPAGVGADASGPVATTPPVLVLSLPRSGSSWVGNLLGCAPDALYLREPVTQSEPKFHRLGTVFRVDRPELVYAHKRLGDKAFRGSTVYPDSVLPFPPHRDSERGAGGGGRRVVVVIKEVNPCAAPWYLHWYAPRLVLLVRHPAAVALSFQRLGWLGPDAGEWERNGVFQASALRVALEAAEGYPAGRAVTYESLCRDPLAGFEALYDFAGLTWGDGARRYVETYSRDSLATADAWRSQVPGELLGALRRGFRRSDLPWFRDDDEWGG